MLTTWATRWGIPHLALAELAAILGAASEPEHKFPDATTEQGVQQRERLAASKVGGRLWRNNCGAFQDATGRWVRYGLCNDSVKLNQTLKSSDLIGIMPVVITEQMVGKVFGQFVAREVKRPGWTYTGTEREQAQLAFLTLIASLGGDARFVS